MKKTFNFRIVLAIYFIIACFGTTIAQDLSTEINANIPASGLNLTLDSVVYYNTATGGNINAMRDTVFNNWVYPDGYVVGPSAIVSNVYKMGDQTGLDTTTVSNHMTFLSSGPRSIQIGDKLYSCSYTLIDSTYGTFYFTTIGYEDGAGNAKFEPFFYMCPLHHSNYIKVTQPGVTHDVEFSVKNIFGAGANGWGDVKISCSGQTVTDCYGLVGGDATFLWEYQITKDCATVGKCCRCIFRFGFASGFSSVGVGVDGVSITLTGSFGWKGSTEKAVKRCCPTGALVAFHFEPQVSGTPSSLLTVSTVNGMTGWVAGTGSTVRRTTDGGANWTNASGNGLTGDISNIFALDENTAFCTSSPASSFIFKTTDGGNQWNMVYNQPGGFINAIEMISPSEGFAVGDPVGGKWTVLHTNNSGDTWQRIPTEPNQIGAEAGWNNSFQILGNHMWFGTNDNRIYYSNDLGLTWNSGNTPGTLNSYAIHFNNELEGLAGGDGMSLTTTGGISFAPANNPDNLNEVYGLEGFGPDWWAVGDLTDIYLSGNSGTTWAKVYSLDNDAGPSLLTAIDFSTAGGDATGWITGSNGEIIKLESEAIESTLDLTALIEGFYNTGTLLQVGDTVNVLLRNTSSPFAVVDSAQAFLDSTGNAVINFSQVTNGSYYIVVKHRNSIETWSAAGVSINIGGVTVYDFTVLNNQAYGSNLTFIGTEWCIFGGDIQQDGSVTLADILLVYNDAANFTTGYVSTDVTGDNIVDLTDISLTYNNGINFVTKIQP